MANGDRLSPPTASDGAMADAARIVGLKRRLCRLGGNSAAQGAGAGDDARGEAVHCGCRLPFCCVPRAKARPELRLPPPSPPGCSLSERRRDKRGGGSRESSPLSTRNSSKSPDKRRLVRALHKPRRLYVDELRNVPPLGVDAPDDVACRRRSNGCSFTAASPNSHTAAPRLRKCGASTLRDGDRDVAAACKPRRNTASQPRAAVDRSGGGSSEGNAHGGEGERALGSLAG